MASAYHCLVNKYFLSISMCQASNRIFWIYRWLSMPFTFKGHLALGKKKKKKVIHMPVLSLIFYQVKRP